MRGLHQEDLLVLHEPGDRALQHVGGRNMVGVEDQDQVAVGLLESGVDIAGLGVIVAVAGQVMAAQTVAQRLQLMTPGDGFGALLDIGIVALLLGAAIVEQIDLLLAGRIAHRQAAAQRHLQQVRALIIAGHIDVERRRVVAGTQAQFRPAQRIEIDEDAEHENREGVEFGGIQQPGGEGRQGVGQLHGVERAPHHVAQAQEDAGQQDAGAPPVIGIFGTALGQGHHAAETDHRHQALCFRIGRQDGKEGGDGGEHDPEGDSPADQARRAQAVQNVPCELHPRGHPVLQRLER